MGFIVLNKERYAAYRHRDSQLKVANLYEAIGNKSEHGSTANEWCGTQTVRHLRSRER